MRDYTEHPEMSQYLLEDSFVLEIAAAPGELTLRADLVLTFAHPLVQPPKPGEQMCFASGQIEFRGVTALTWTEQGSPPALGADGVVDYGHIDSCRWDGSTFELSGDFGSIRTVASSVNVALDG